MNKIRYKNIVIMLVMSMLLTQLSCCEPERIFAGRECEGVSDNQVIGDYEEAGQEYVPVSEAEEEERVIWKEETLEEEKVSDNSLYLEEKEKLAITASEECEADCVYTPSENMIRGPVITGLAARTPEMVNGYVPNMLLTVSANAGDYPLALEPYSAVGPFESQQQSLDSEYMSFGDGNEFQLSENGYYYFTVMDVCGNTHTVESLITEIDNEAPEISGINIKPVDEVNEYGRSAIISIAAYDLKSGLMGEAFSFDDGLTYTGDYYRQVSENGIYTLRVRDAVGNEVRKLCEVACIDDISPTLIITGNSELSVTDSITLLLNLSDWESGLSEVWYKAKAEEGDGSLLTVYNGQKNGSERVTLRSNGSYVFKVMDRQKNVTEKEITVSTIVKSSSSSSDKEKKSSSIRKSSSTKKSSSVRKSVVISSGMHPERSNESSENKTVILRGKSTKETGKEKEKGYENKRTVIINEADEADEEEDFEIDELSRNDILQLNTPEFYGLEEEYRHESVSANAALRDREEELVIPELSREEGPDERMILALGIGIIVLLVLVLCLVLSKLKLVSFARLFEREKKDKK